MQREVLVALLATSVVGTSVARADDVGEAYAALNTTDRRLQLGLAVGGAASVVAGATLCGFDRDDHALQVAGGVTLAFGVADLAAGVAGYVLAKREALRFSGVLDRRDELLALSDKKGVVFGVNLGVDVAFITAGLTAVAASQLNVDHRDRWLAGGLAAATQGAFAAVIDLVGTIASRRAHRRALGR